MEPSREEMAETVKLLRSCCKGGFRLYGNEAEALVAYIDLLEKRVRELGGEP